MKFKISLKDKQIVLCSGTSTITITTTKLAKVYDYSNERPLTTKANINFTNITKNLNLIVSPLNQQ